MRIALVWQGLDGRYKYNWRDGLYGAMKLIEKEHEVKYFDFPLTGIDDFKPDVVLYWEALCTQDSKDGENYRAVLALPYKKALLFAGGPIKLQYVHGFDMYFVESEVNEQEFEDLGVPWKRAFGVNTQVMKPMDLPKVWEGMIHATFADWKRHQLFAEALGVDGLAVGRVQDHDRNGYNECIARGVKVLNEQTPDEVARLINHSWTVVNTASLWGGGQRCTLEAMACGVPVVVMDDSPKNAEYIKESVGAISKPDPVSIRACIETIKENYEELSRKSVEYVHSKWTEKHYADALLEGISEVV